MFKKSQLIKGLSAVAVVSGVGVGGYLAYSHNLFSGLIKTTENTVSNKDISINENTPFHESKSSEILASNNVEKEESIQQTTIEEEVTPEAETVSSPSVNSEENKDQIVNVLTTNEVTFTSTEAKEGVKTYTSNDGTLLIKAIVSNVGFTWDSKVDKFQEKQILDVIDFYKKKSDETINEESASVSQFKNTKETRIFGLSQNSFYLIKIKDSYSLNKIFELINKNSKKVIFEIIKTIS